MPTRTVDPAELDVEDVTLDTKLPALGDPPVRPERPEPTAGPLAGELTAGQRAYLDGIVGDEWTVAITGTVARWEPVADDDGTERARIILTVEGRGELPVVDAVLPPPSAEELDAARAAEEAAEAAYAEAVAAYEEETRRWQHHASLIAQRDSLAAQEAATVEANQRAEAEAARFAAAVDERIRAILADPQERAALGIPAAD
jgi:hypothetical protein